MSPRSTNVLVLVTLLMVVSAAADKFTQSTSAIPSGGGVADGSDADEVGSLIQTVAEGKARQSSLIEAEGNAKASHSFCASGDEQRVELAKAETISLKDDEVSVVMPKQVKSMDVDESPTTIFPMLSLVIAAALGTVVARGILTLRPCTSEADERCVAMPKQSPSLRMSPSSKALLEATHSKDAKLVMKLVKSGVDVNSADDWGFTPLHVAAKLGEAKVARELLAGGANPNACEAWEETPLHVAARAGSAEVCELLMAKGADADMLNSDDQTALLVAAHAGQKVACEVLLRCGAGAGGAADDDLPPLLKSLFTNQCLAACLAGGGGQ